MCFMQTGAYGVGCDDHVWVLTEDCVCFMQTGARGQTAGGVAETARKAEKD